MSQGIYNLHNHTPFSDGAYSIDEICEAHLKLRDLQVEGIGISDHLFCTPSSREITNEREFERLFAREVRRYVAHVHEARQRWAGRLNIVCGCEINWPLNKTMLQVIRTMLEGIDYVLFENLDWAGLTTLANQARRWPCRVGLAHTEVSVQFPNTSMDQVVRTLANARLFYEINSKFLPLADSHPWFAVLPRHRVMVSIGTDTHDDLRCIEDLPVLLRYAQRHGLGEKLIVPQPLEPAGAPLTARAAAGN